MYSYHSSPEEKNKLLYSLTQYGIETTVDRGAKKDRIRAWIENSIIDEEDEEAAEAEEDDEDHVNILDNQTGPVGERMDRGPVQASPSKVHREEEKKKRRQMRQAAINKRTSAVYVPPVDPRIPLDKQRLTRSAIDLTIREPEPPEEDTYAPKDKYFEKFSSRIGQVESQVVSQVVNQVASKLRKDSVTVSSTQTSLSNGSTTDVATISGSGILPRPEDFHQKVNGSSDTHHQNGYPGKSAKAAVTVPEVHVNEQPVRVPQVQLINSRDLRRDVKIQTLPPKMRYGRPAMPNNRYISK